ncbi:hypothetical protein HPB50_021360 [Hyalomma asiaticum]|uniref:Uncharacterized protein n=1 Tax=Hyalomma asiaticum TaxID=266040 RepID=A0ACB7SSN0_HYAAI|nr:hypothetical protein HPB50_021360 [Hyalomma asiaticum]
MATSVTCEKNRTETAKPAHRTGNSPGAHCRRLRRDSRDERRGDAARVHGKASRLARQEETLPSRASQRRHIVRVTG